MPRRAPRTPEEEEAYQLKWGAAMQRDRQDEADEAAQREIFEDGEESLDQGE